MALPEQQLVEQLEQVQMAYVLTDKYQKVEGISSSARGLGVKTSIIQAPQAMRGEYNEPQFTSARKTSSHKAAHGQEQHEQYHPGVDRHDVAYIGVDTVFLDPEPTHKLKDEKEKTILLALSELQRLLSWTKKEQQQAFAWNIAISSWNGADVTLEYFVSMKARSIDPEVIRQAIEDAVETGIITKVNTRIALIELLLELDAVSQIAIARSPENFDWSRELAGDRAVLKNVEAAILETNPLRLSVLQPLRKKH